MPHSTSDGRVSHATSRAHLVEFHEAADAKINELLGQPAAGEQVGDGYDAMSKTDLAELCRTRGLAVTGNKPDLVARLREADTAAGSP